MNLHGFKIKDQKHSEEIQGDYILLEHEKSGAQLIFIQNEDNNRVFMIGFRTPSNNSTGVAHILEHSTLCGSDKYPVKEPFVELLKGSLNTFLNAMTYPDKTVYPVASINKKDFRNLTDVYLDAVFNPKIYENPYIFMQEGWHYHLEDKNDPLQYNGVVYNEMKGAYSDPEEIVSKAVFESLYPDTIYSEDSGGSPLHIPDLTYEDFIKFHKRFYHPSNSYIVVYGDNDLEEQLEYLDSWLRDYNRAEINSEIKTQKKFDHRVEKETTYAINPNESLENKDIITLNYVMDENLSPRDKLALNIINTYLFDKTSGVISNRIFDENLAEDVFSMVEFSLKQPLFSIEVKNTDLSKKDQIISTIEDTLKDLVENGFDSNILEALINRNEFSTLEKLNGEDLNLPKGLPIGINLIADLMYDQDPYEELQLFEQYKQIRKLKEENYFENLTKTLLLENPHQSVVSLKPDKELLEKQNEALAQKLKDYKDSLSDKELDEIVQETQKLIENQNREDTKEALETIPRLKIDEIDREIEKVDYEVIEEDCPVIYVENKQGNLVYLELNFLFSGIAQEDLPYLRILKEIFAVVDTKNYSFVDLDLEYSKYTGGISNNLLISSSYDTDEVKPYFNIRLSTKEDNLKKTIELLDEVINRSIYTDKEHIKTLIDMFRLQKKSFIQSFGNAVASLRLIAGTSLKGRLSEEVDGISFYNFLSDLDDNFDSNWDKLEEKLISIAQKVFNINNLIVSFSCSESYKDKALEEIRTLIKTFADDEVKLQEYEFKELPKTEAFIVPGNVMYNAKGGKINLKDEDINYGTLQVLASYLTTDYLWNRIRVLGGAYGTNLRVTRDGDITFSTFRDPNIDKTYQNIDEAADTVENLDLTQRDLDKFIIGTINTTDQPLSTKNKLALATNNYMTGLTNEKLQAERDHILGTTLEDLKKLSSILKKAVGQERYVTIGTQKDINSSETDFEEVNFIE